jgi:hypothetical protein
MMERRKQAAVYLYAAVPAHTSLAGAGTPTDIRLIEADDVSLVVGTPDMPTLADAANPDSGAGSLGELARQHDAVIRAVMAVSDTISPFRLGTIVTDDTAARHFVVSHRTDLLALLRRLRASAEWGVTVSVENVRPRAARRRPSDRSGSAYLATRRQQLADEERRRTEHAATIAVAADELRELAIDAAHGAQRGAVILDESYLVSEAATPSFLDVVDHLTKRLTDSGLSMRVTGPWPPYSFARLTGGEQ